MPVMKHWQRLLGLSLLGTVALAAGNVQAQSFGEPRIIELRAPGAKGNVFIQAPATSKFWLGLFCRPVDEALRVQLKLPAGQGVVVDGVAPESPAAKAELQRFDVILAVGDKPLADPTELLKFVEEAGEAKLTFKLIRNGEEKSVEVTPATRPELPGGEAFQLPRQNLDTLKMWVDRLNDPAHGPIHLRGFGPGVMFGQRALPQLPDGVSIQINKTGQQPAKIVVTRGEDKWELTDSPEQLAKLPDDIRPAVESMLGHGLRPFQVRIPGPQDMAGSSQPKAEDASGGNVEQRLKEVERRLETLLEELKQK